MTTTPGLADLLTVTSRLRTDCPWDAEQTHLSLVKHLVEECCELVEAIETESEADLREELGDVLFQVVFHATIAAERGAFTLDEVAAELAAKLVQRHPYIFAGEDTPDDLEAAWEQRKSAQKGRTSVLDGIPDRLSALTRATKSISRARRHGVAVALPSDPIATDDLADQLLALTARAQASGLDAEQVLRTAIRRLDADITAAEGSGSDQG